VPVFKLTLWETSIARDEEIYLVIADTKERAAALLRKLHTQACETGEAAKSSQVTCVYHPDDEQHEVWQLEPNDIVGGNEGIEDEDGNEVELDESNDFGPVMFTE
jgi:hypothetical protein